MEWFLTTWLSYLTVPILRRCQRLVCVCEVAPIAHSHVTPWSRWEIVARGANPLRYLATTNRPRCLFFQKCPCPTMSKSSCRPGCENTCQHSAETCHPAIGLLCNLNMHARARPLQGDIGMQFRFLFFSAIKKICQPISIFVLEFMSK